MRDCADKGNADPTTCEQCVTAKVAAAVQEYKDAPADGAELGEKDQTKKVQILRRTVFQLKQTILKQALFTQRRMAIDSDGGDIKATKLRKRNTETDWQWAVRLDKALDEAILEADTAFNERYADQAFVNDGKGSGKKLKMNLKLGTGLKKFKNSSEWLEIQENLRDQEGRLSEVPEEHGDEEEEASPGAVELGAYLLGQAFDSAL